MEPGGSMPHLQEPSNDPYPEPNQPSSSCSDLFFNLLSAYDLIPRHTVCSNAVVSRSKHIML